MTLLSKKKLVLGIAALSLCLLNNQPVEAKELSTQHVEYKTLSDSQKALIQTGTPTIAQEDLACKYVLIYQPTNPTSPLKVLPHTGSLGTDLAIYGLGFSMLTLAGYLLYKNKKTSRHLIVAVLVSGGLVSATVTQADMITLSQTETIVIETGQAFTIAPKTIDGYEYIGYLTESCHIQEGPSTSTTKVTKTLTPTTPQSRTSETPSTNTSTSSTTHTAETTLTTVTQSHTTVTSPEPTITTQSWNPTTETTTSTATHTPGPGSLAV